MIKTNDEYEKLFLLAQKPGRYVGGEYNSYSDFDTKARFCLCFPDVYEVAISNLGNKIIYHMVNDSEGYSCERCYSPWFDMANLLRENNLPLFSLETRTSLKDFDVLGMSLSYEMSYTNMLDMMNLANIPLRTADRGEDCPLIFAGGVCTVNPEPIAHFVDFVALGEGETNIFPILDLIEKKKDNGWTKGQFLQEVNKLPFIYVPSLHEETFVDGKFNGLSDAKTVVKAIAKDLDKAYFPTNQIVPNIEAVHDRGVIEVFRGCPRGCRFCQASFVYRPIRAKTKETLVGQCGQMILDTGFDEYSLSSLSTGDYPDIVPTLKDMVALTRKHKVRMSLPSLRLDSFDADFLSDRRQTASLTFAPEAGTQRLRDVINKNITEEELESAMATAIASGVKSVKLYFMIGLPTETDEDVAGIFYTAKKVKDLYRELTGRKDLNVSASVANFVPKPFTPFQWCAQDSSEEFDRKHKLLKELFYKSHLTLRYHNAFVSKLEGVFALGGREVCDLLERAYLKGCNFDGWTEGFKRNLWKEAVEESGIDIDALTSGYSDTDVLPWHFVDIGVSEKFFRREYEKAMGSQVTGDCMDKCLACGATKLGECKLCW